MPLDPLETPPPLAVHTSGRPRWGTPPREPWLVPGLVAALVAGAATAGVLVRFGIASGDGALAAFDLVGRIVTGVTLGDGAWARRGAALAGILVHFAVATVWALVFARLAAGWRGWRVWAAAVGVATFACLAGLFVLPSVLRIGHGVWVPAPQLVLLHAVLALSLALGIRLALEPGTTSGDASRRGEVHE